MKRKKSLWARIKGVVHEKKNTSHYKFNKIGKLRVHEITDPDVVHHILRHDEKFNAPSFVKKAIGRFIGNALILDEGESWQNMHDLMVDIFSPKGVNKTISPIIMDECDKMIDRWLKEENPLDMEKEMRSLTAHVVIRVTLGDSITEQEADDIIDASTVTIESFRKPHTLTILSRALGLHYDYIPPMKPVYKKAAKAIDDILDKIIDQRRQLVSQPDDILGRLLEATDVATQKPLTQKQIKDQLVMFIVAGHETTAVGLTFALHEILKHPDALAKIHAEIDRIAPDRHLKGSDYSRLSDVRNAFKEALRLHPSAYEIARESDVDTTIDNIEFRKHDLIRMSVLEMHRDPDLWEDAANFTPDRFKENSFPAAYLPFGAGPRVCLGMTMALTEGTLALAEIFNRVTLKMTQEPTGELLVFTMRPCGKLEAVASPRKTFYP